VQAKTHGREEMMKTITPRRALDLNPWRDFDAMERRMRRMLGEAWPQTESPMDWVPSMDLHETDGAFELSVELPGLKPEEVELSVEENVLTIRGEKKEEKRKDEGKWHLLERAHGSFERSFTLPRGVDDSQVKADFKNGILKVQLPKRAEAQGRKIPIEA
jgi:HSP20 family protein